MKSTLLEDSSLLVIYTLSLCKYIAHLRLLLRTGPWMIEMDNFLEKVCTVVYHSLFHSQRLETLGRFGL
jgi:hypothetical protein